MRIVPALALLLTVAALARAADVSETDFHVRNAQELVNLCTVAAGDDFADEAIHFCHGFVSGAWRYHEAQAAGPNGTRLVCFPEPLPTRNQAIGEFVTWSKAHPEHMTEPAVEALFRFLVGKWPCPKPSAAAGGTQP